MERKVLLWQPSRRWYRSSLVCVKPFSYFYSFPSILLRSFRMAQNCSKLLEIVPKCFKLEVKRWEWLEVLWSVWNAWNCNFYSPGENLRETFRFVRNEKRDIKRIKHITVNICLRKLPAASAAFFEFSTCRFFMLLCWIFYAHAIKRITIVYLISYRLLTPFHSADFKFKDLL